MEAFTTLTGRLAVVPDDNVDTDRIIPARFLSRVSKLGYGDLLFADVRGDGFALDLPEAKGASVLVVGSNFGCGSSREHAVWAIQQAGFKAVIAKATPDKPGYSDIFRQNSANCGLLLIELPEADHQELLIAGSGAQVTIDLPNQMVTLLPNARFSFEINEVTKQALVQGLDLIGTTLIYDDEIRQYEQRSKAYVPKT
jgi:3-isopropylmalate/(R)-2-methylmalate dehydratase small subunit